MNFIASTITRWESQNDPDIFNYAADLANEIGWNNVLKEAFITLCSQRFIGLWFGAVFIIHAAPKRNMSLPYNSNELIARLYWCLEKYEKLRNPEKEKVVWAVVYLLTGNSPELGWKPEHDSEIYSELNKLK
jgi:hypothetical protein